MIDLDELERLTNAATKGPWTHDRHGSVLAGRDQVALATGSAAMRDERMPTGDVMEANAIFIAAARDGLPSLIGRVREMEAAQERHLRLIHDLSKAEPLPTEAEDLKRQNAVLIAEVGTLRAKLAAFDVSPVLRGDASPEVIDRLREVVRAHSPIIIPARDDDEQARADEREACALVADARAAIAPSEASRSELEIAADLIRARGVR